MHQATQKNLSHRARKGYFLLQNKPTSLNPSPASLIFLPLFPYSSPFSLQTQGCFVCSRAGATCHSWSGVTAITVAFQIFISRLCFAYCQAYLKIYQLKAELFAQKE